MPAVTSGSISFHRDVMNDCIRSVSCRFLFLALLWQTTFLPSRCFQEDFLGLVGFDCELVIGAFVTACWAFSFVRIGVVKNEEVRPAHVIDVVV